MIIFSLKCSKGHSFDEWFASSAEFDAQAAAGEIPCPECGDTTVGKALMAPNIGVGTAEPAPACGAPSCSNGGCPMFGPK